MFNFIQQLKLMSRGIVKSAPKGSWNYAPLQTDDTCKHKDYIDFNHVEMAGMLGNDVASLLSTPVIPDSTAYINFDEQVGNLCLGRCIPQITPVTVQRIGFEPQKMCLGLPSIVFTAKLTGAMQITSWWDKMLKLFTGGTSSPRRRLLSSSSSSSSTGGAVSSAHYTPPLVINMTGAPELDLTQLYLSMNFSSFAETWSTMLALTPLFASSDFEDVEFGLLSTLPNSTTARIMSVLSTTAPTLLNTTVNIGGYNYNQTVNSTSALVSYDTILVLPFDMSPELAAQLEQVLQQPGSIDLLSAS